jgi:tRNA (adenine22-N1)-methyltransferase
MRLSTRLSGLNDLIENHYDHIWDTCCDHGFLGAHLLSTKRSPAIHFVDCNQAIMLELKNKLQKYFPPNTKELAWHTHTIGAEACPIADYPGKHLVIVAGVGGDLAAEIVVQLHKAYANLDVDFLVCATNHTFLLRQELLACNFALISERLVEDKKYFYELILLRQTHHSLEQMREPVKALSAAGDEMWEEMRAHNPRIAAAYLEQLKKHYTRLLNSNRAFAEQALAAYGQIEPLTKG